MSGPPAVTVATTGLGLDGPIAASFALLLVLTLAGLFASGAAQIPADLLYIAPLLLCALGLAGWCIARTRSETSASVLRWDGRHWSWSRQHGDSVLSVDCALDLQAWMLLRLQTGEGPCEWMWLRREDHVKSWCALRRALIFDALSAHDRPVASDWNSV